MSYWRNFALCAFIVLSVRAQEKLKICLSNEQACKSLSRHDSPIRCNPVINSANCAISLADGSADFGIFTADELLLTNHFYPTGVQVVAQLRNKDKNNVDLQYQSVAVVPTSYESSNGSFKGLFGLGFCHPGFSKSQLWNDHVLKYFEQKVMNNVCQEKMTVAENEIKNLKEFFKKGCRPGEWVSDSEFDKDLKNKYPELCELCDDKTKCSYLKQDNHGHVGALDCLTLGRGQVAYASLHYVQEYFSRSFELKKNYQFLCENGSVMPLNTEKPCVWFQQPWNVIAAREVTANSVLERLKEASVTTFRAMNWTETLHSILFKENDPIFYDPYKSPSDYLREAREVEVPKATCGADIRWCTLSDVETNKCNWTSAAALITGIRPAIACVPATSTFECFRKISNNEADIITIDSNYGHLARQVYSLSSILYAETVPYSFVVAVIRESSQNRRISRFADLKDSNVCFPEYGGIAWLSFINVAREHNVLPDSCEYPQIVSRLLRNACAPGFLEANHSKGNKKPKVAKDDLSKLCALCPTQSNGETCQADSQNPYYGDKGAIDCLRSGTGDIAFLEVRNLQNFVNNGSITDSDYRVLCKNGSLAEYTGFNVDDACALSVTIDSEIVTRRECSTKQLTDTTLALLEVEDWLGFRGDEERRPIHVYSSFNGTANLLFKDTTAGLVAKSSDVKAVRAYRELFRHVDACSGALSIIATVSLILLNFFVTRHVCQ